MDLNNLSTQLKKLTNHFIAEKFDFVITNGKVLLAKYPFSSYLQNLIGQVKRLSLKQKVQRLLSLQMQI